MSAITLDPTTAAALTAADTQVDILDAAGKRLGVFLPSRLADEATQALEERSRILAWGKTQISEEELKTIAAEPAARTMEDVFKLLEGS